MINTRTEKLAFAIIITLSVLAVLAKLGVFAQNYAQMNESLSMAQPTLTHWFGFDFFGRDIFSRGVHGAFTALTVGAMAAGISTVCGTVLGLTSGFFESWWDDIVLAITTVLESIPYILLLGAIAFVFGQGLINVYLSLGLTSWVVLCRLLRTECLRQKSMDYVLAARAIGVSDMAILWRHILPNVSHIIFTQFVIVFIFAIKAEVILTYLGLGVEPGSPSWGYMLDESKQELVNGFWGSFLCVTLLMGALVLSLNTLVGKRDV